MATMSSASAEVISKETIKPSTPTPYQLKNFHLSIIDQHVPAFFTPIILFYPATVTGSNLHDDLDLLKSSLSETLTLFYPMAGRLKNNMMVECNDQGIDFVVVKIKGKMSYFVLKPDAPLTLLLPSEFVSKNTIVEEAQLIVQVSMFNCGGTAICLCLSHKIVDGIAATTFIRNWAATTNIARCGGANIVPPTTIPSFDSASLFPPSEEFASASGMPPKLSFLTEMVSRRDYKAASKRFVFDEVKIKSVREKLQVYRCHRPTRVEVVSALIWKSVMKSTPVGSLSTVGHAVNIRNKLEPPLKDVSFGNVALFVATVLEATASATTITTNKTVSSMRNELLHEISYFIAQLRGDINKVKGDKGCMEKIIRDSCASKGINRDVKNEAISLTMSSWCRMGIYETDFGWGKPIWVTVGPDCTGTQKNMIFMNDMRYGEGVEVWARFLEDDMAKFEIHLSEILELFPASSTCAL